MNKTSIRKLIAEGKLENAIDKIVQNIKWISDEQDRNDFLLQSNRLKRIIREKGLGIVTEENANLTTNQIANSVLTMLDQIKLSRSAKIYLSIKNYKIISLILIVLVFIFCLLKFYFKPNLSYSAKISDSSFSETNPPNNLVTPGSIALIEDNTLKIICTSSNSLGESIKQFYIESPSPPNITKLENPKNNYNVDLDILERHSLSRYKELVKSISLKLSDVKIIELPDDAIFENLRNRTTSCSRAIKNRKDNGQKITMIKRVLQANAQYEIELIQDISEFINKDLFLKELAIELTGKENISNGNLIYAENLFFGVDDDMSLGNLDPNTPAPTGTIGRERLTKNSKSYNVEVEKVNYNIEPIKQPSKMSCWIATYTMMRSWKEGKKYTLNQIAEELGEPWKIYFETDSGLPNNEIENFINYTNLRYEYPASYTLESYKKWLEMYGPLWIISGDMINSHAKLLTGISSDNSGEIAVFEFIDPYTGLKQKMEMLHFIHEYENEARKFNKMYPDKSYSIQIIHF